jgi:hypothetical protein
LADQPAILNHADRHRRGVNSIWDCEQLLREELIDYRG